MSVQFGVWNFDKKPIDLKYVARVDEILSPFGPDGRGDFADSGLAIFYRAFHTTSESCTETQPHILRSGAVLTWDGRLDNADELQRDLGIPRAAELGDVLVVAAAYEQWGTDCFAKLIGDWALSIWDSRSQSLILARDFMGMRSLYYSLASNQIVWSTILEPLVLCSETSFYLEEEYLAGWLSAYPAIELTPYGGIRCVPPSCYLTVRHGKVTTTRYWDFDGNKLIRYTSDAEYEHHYRTLFSQAVRRHLRSNTPILAELSGGMDSSSIVCTADALSNSENSGVARVQTISYFDCSEPTWDELPYIQKVEQQRGTIGSHIDLGESSPFAFRRTDGQLAVTPASISSMSKPFGEFVSIVQKVGSRVILSGIGGDEVTGGVPTPIPELADLLARACFRDLFQKLKTWAIEKRKPIYHIWAETLSQFAPTSFPRAATLQQPAPWLRTEFVRRHRLACAGYRQRLRILGPLPSFQSNLHTLEVLRRQIACRAPILGCLWETRYPFFDRSLLEFLFAIPRNQLVRPGQRRSLMRRALVGIVPPEILQRRRKAYVSRAPLAAISAEWPALEQVSQRMVSAGLGIVDQVTFQDALRNARAGLETPMVPVLRTLALEAWLKQLMQSHLVATTGFGSISSETNVGSRRRSSLSTQEFSAEKV